MMMGSKRLQRLNNGLYGEDRRTAGGFLLADRYRRHAWRFLIKHDCRGKDDCLAQPKNASLHIAPDSTLKVA